MKLNSFKLKSEIIKSDLQAPLEIIRVRGDNSKIETIYHTIKTIHNDIPLYFTYITTSGQKKLSIEELKESMKMEKNELDRLRKQEINQAHYSYIRRKCPEIYGEIYEKIEKREPAKVRLFINTKIKKIISNNSKFKEVFICFIEDFKIEELELYIQK